MNGITLVGAGGIGCAVAYALAAAGWQVTLVESDPAKLAWGARHGVSIDPHPGQPVSMVPFDAWDPVSSEPVLLCTKCYDNEEILRRIPESIPLVPIQNGFDATLEARVSDEGIASFVSECIPGQTRTRLTRPGSLILGGRGKPASPWMATLAKALAKAPFRTQLTDNVIPYKYAKLMYNAAISPLAAAAGVDNGELLRWPEARGLFFALLRENYAILTRAGCPLGKVGPFHPSTVDGILRLPLLPLLLARFFYPGLRGTYCSMARDIAKGRTEIENYNGYLITLAQGHPCPLNQKVYDLVQTMTLEVLPPGRERLAGLRDLPRAVSLT